MCVSFFGGAWRLAASVLPVFLALMASGALLQAQADKRVVDKVVAIVGGEIVQLSDVMEQVSYARQQQPNLPPDYDCFALQNIIVQKVLVHRAKLDSIAVKDEEVELQLDARIDRLMLYFNQDPKAIEAHYGQSIEQLKDQTRNELRNQLLAERIRNKVTEKATITPSEVQQFFNQIPKDSLPFFGSEVEIRELVLKPAVSEAERAKAKATLEELRQRIVDDGEDFANLARKYSDDPGSGSAGGDLGWQKRGAFVPEFEAMAYKLEKNQISPVFETEFGFHIVQLLERRGNLLKSRHILIKPELTDRDLERTQAALDSIRQLIVSGKIAFTEAVKRFGYKKVQSYNNDGRVANPRSGNTFFEVADLDTEIFFAIDDLEPGDISASFGYREADGSKMFRIVELVSRSKPHKANLQQDYSKIQDAALEQKKAEFLESWIEETLADTYLWVDPHFGACPNILEMVKLSSASQAKSN
ncbi:MAG: peptidylprolyl isomerase [Saprospiraceae bacterium]